MSENLKTIKEVADELGVSKKKIENKLSYIKKKGNELKENKEISNLPQKFIPELINLQNEINSLVLKCFKNNFILQNAKIKGFGDLMRPDFYSKQIAFYIDYCMRNEFKGKSQEYIDKTLNDIIELFKNLTSKLLFGVESDVVESDGVESNGPEFGNVSP